MSEDAGRGARVAVVGATGYIGRHVVRELVERGHDVRALARRRAGVGGRHDEATTRARLAGADVRFVDVVSDPSRDLGPDLDGCDVVVSCLASRTGHPTDAWAVDHDANRRLLAAATLSDVRRFVLLSAICVQRPRLAFQHAKLAFERELAEAPLDHAIVRPTAFFKSLAGQIEAVRRGRPFTLLGDGRRTACKPISERDLARFLADCVERPEAFRGVLPIGGPGAAITPLAQGELLFQLTGRAPRYRHVPLRVLDAVVGSLSLAARVSRRFERKAELARTGHYYATESMLVFDERTGRYDADATPSFGADTLADFYATALSHGLEEQDLGDHAVFARSGGDVAATP